MDTDPGQHIQELGQRQPQGVRSGGGGPWSGLHRWHQVGEHHQELSYATSGYFTQYAAVNISLADQTRVLICGLTTINYLVASDHNDHVRGDQVVGILTTAGH